MGTLCCREVILPGCLEFHPPKSALSSPSAVSLSSRITSPDDTGPQDISLRLPTHITKGALTSLDGRIPDIDTVFGRTAALSNLLSGGRQFSDARSCGHFGRMLCSRTLSPDPLPVCRLSRVNPRCRSRSAKETITSICVRSTCNIRDNNHG